MIKEFTEFRIKDKIYFSHYPIYEKSDVNKASLLAIDFNIMSSYPNINAIPVVQVFYTSLQELYVIKNNYVVIGGLKDICLI